MAVTISFKVCFLCLEDTLEKQELELDLSEDEDEELENGLRELDALHTLEGEDSGEISRCVELCLLCLVALCLRRFCFLVVFLPFS